MGRRSKIEQLGIGSKVVSYHYAGLSAPEIATKVNREHEGAELSDDQVLIHLKRHSADIREHQSIVRNNSVLWTLEEIRQRLCDTVGEIQSYISKHGDDPRAVGMFIKVKIDALDKIAKMLGGYPPENRVNVQVNNVFTKEVLEKSLAEAEEYFQRLQAAD